MYAHIEVPCGHRCFWDLSSVFPRKVLLKHRKHYPAVWNVEDINTISIMFFSNQHTECERFYSKVTAEHLLKIDISTGLIELMC